MRYVIILLGLLVSCSQAITGTKYYQLADSNSDKDFLNKTIEEYRKKGFDYENPSLVIDGYLYKGTDLNSISQLKLKKCELKSIHFMNAIGAKNIYGQIGEGGIILIGTKKCEDKTELKIADSLSYKG